MNVMDVLIGSIGPINNHPHDFSLFFYTFVYLNPIHYYLFSPCSLLPLSPISKITIQTYMEWNTIIIMTSFLYQTKNHGHTQREQVQKHCAFFVCGGMECLSPTHHSPPPPSSSTIHPHPLLSHSHFYMEMERERYSCKLCSRTFVNGRALGGHMKAHLYSPRPTPHIPPTPTLSSTDDEDKSPATIYGLREKPRKSIKLSFSTSGASPLLDGDSEAESKIRKRRSGRIVGGADDTESPEAEPVSSVSETSPEEDVAMCLVMLSRDDGLRRPAKKVREIGVADTATQKQKQHQCEICKKIFRSSQALGGHRIIHRKKVVVAEERIVADNKPKSFGSNRNRNHDDNNSYVNESRRIFECSFCGKVFGSGQALGGHKRSHLMGGFGRSSSSVVVGGWEKITPVKNANNNSSSNDNVSFIDLNMPAPVEDEDVYSVVSDDDDDGGPANY